MIRSSGRVSMVACRMYTSRPMRLAAAYASVVLPTPGLPSRRGFMGRSWSFTTSHAASNCRISSSCPTQRTFNSSGCARCRVTPSISTVILTFSYEIVSRGLSFWRKHKSCAGCPLHQLDRYPSPHHCSGPLQAAERNVVFRIKDTINLAAARLEERRHLVLGDFLFLHGFGELP